MSESEHFTIGCVVPARNESGNIERVFESIRQIPQITEVMFVEGGSTDDTIMEIQECKHLYPSLVSFTQQQGTGKFDAVLQGVKLMKSRKIIIWDADNTVSLEDTKRIVEEALNDNNSIVGDRLHGVREKDAMRFANLIGNWIFALLWKPVNNWKAQDMLCGTKVFPRNVYLEIPNWMINIDPFGDFALVANSYRLGIPVKFIPVRYRARIHGETNIRRWRSGIVLMNFLFVYYSRMLREKLS